MKKIHNYINGKSFSISKKELPVEDPSKGEVIAELDKTVAPPVVKATTILLRIRI